MSFATDFEIGFSTKRALRDKRQLEQALESLARKAEKTGKRMDRALGRGAAQATRNLKGVAKSINRASTATKRMEKNLRNATTASQKLATSQRAVTQATRTAAAQSIAAGAGAGVGAGVGAGAVGATKAHTASTTAATAANAKFATSFGSVTAGAAAAKGSLMRLAGPVALLLGAKGLGAAAIGAVRFADEIGKTAGKLGVTTNALQEFRFAAGQSGVNVQTATMALQRFTRRAAEAAKDTGEAKEAFKTMGIQLTDVNGNLRDSQELLGDVAEAITNTESAGERLRLAFKLFDSEGVALVNTMLGGRKGFEAYAAEARKLGIIFDKDLIGRGELLANDLDKASLAISVNFKQALLDVAPILLKVSQGVGFLSEGLRFMADSARPLQDKTLPGLQIEFQKVRERIETTRSTIAKLQADISGDKPFSIDFFSDQVSESNLKGAQRQLAALVKQFETIRGLIRERTAVPPPSPVTGPIGGTEVLGFVEDVEITNLIERLKTERIAAERAITMVTLSEHRKRQASIVHQFQDALIATKGDLDARLAAEQAFVKKLEALEAEAAAKTAKTEKKLTDDILELINKRANAQERYGEIQEEITSLIDAGTISTLQGARALEHYAKQLDLMEDSANSANQRLSALGSTLSDDVLGTFSDAIVDFDFENVADSLIAANRSLLKGVIEEGLRPVLAGGFQSISEGVGGEDTFLGKIFKGASDQALGVVGASEGEKLIIEAINKTTDAVRGGGVSTGVEDGLQGMAVSAREDSIAIQQELAIQTTETRTGFANVSNRVIDMTNILPGLFGSLFSLLSGGSGASTLDKVLGMVGALAGVASQFAGGATSGSAGSSGTTVVGDFPAGFGSGAAGIAARGGVVGRSHFPSRRVASSVFAGAARYQRGGVIGRNNVVPILAHRGELITPLEGGTLPVDIKNGVPEVRTPGGDRVPVDIRGERDIGPTVFAAGSIVIMAQPGERLDRTVGQAVEAAFAQGARSQRRNTGRAG